jgi:coenzyme F420-dependent glucose-6-phosphate dehydrogenase
MERTRRVGAYHGQAPTGYGRNCPLIRIHPAIVAQAAATVATMTLGHAGQVFLGVGTGEYLNEHITAEKWPTPAQRLEMLEEAIEIMRNLWRGGWHSHEGLHYTVQHARIFTLSEKPPAIMMAAAKPRAAELAGRVADGLISFESDAGIVKSFEAAGGEDKPRYGQLTVSFGADEAESAKAVHRYWPNAGVGGRLMTDLELPHHFEEVIALTNPEKTIEGFPCGPDPRRHIEGIERYIDAGYDHVYIHQVGPRQEEFIRFYSEPGVAALQQACGSIQRIQAERAQRRSRQGPPAALQREASVTRQIYQAPGKVF